MSLLDPDRLEVHLVIESTGGVVVARGVSGGDGERHVEAASDLVEDFSLKLTVGRRGLRCFELPHLPSAGHRHQHAAFELNQVHRLECFRFSVGWGVGVEDSARESSDLGSCDDRQGVPSQVSEQRECRGDVWNPASLSRPVLAEVVDHAAGWHSVVLDREAAGGVAGVLLENVVGDRVAVLVELNSVDGVDHIEHGDGGRRA